MSETAAATTERHLQQVLLINPTITSLPTAARLERDLLRLRDGLGADSIQYCDHNFFDREADMVPPLEVLARVQMPWWCYARADALLNLSSASWSLHRKSRLRMAYIRRTTRCSSACARAPGPIRPWRLPICAATRASSPSRHSWSRHRTSPRGIPNGRSSSSGRSNVSIRMRKS